MMIYASALLRIVERAEEKENSIIILIPIAKKNHLFHQAEKQTDKQM